ncbi:MaoC/PaaZ C-terminal domain-containing protein [Streptomyces sp. NPDC058534]|uniref:MaoC/PaaZ C-terminal domain-containing protein n=1 Tax=Streptomyces sp. NPDC058534 TaxID=3346541 RepID=UPI00365F3AAA
MTTANPTTTTLTGPPALAPLLARGALLSPLKRPRPDADFPRTRLVLPGLRVDLARLAAYERVCGFPTGADALPVTYPHVLGFPLAMRLMSGRDFPLPLLGLVHTSIAITRYAVMPATAVYELTTYVEALAPHRRGTEATVATEARAGGEVVWESRSTYLARHGGTGASGREHGSPAPDPGSGPLPEQRQSAADCAPAGHRRAADDAEPGRGAPAPDPGSGPLPEQRQSAAGCALAGQHRAADDDAQPGRNSPPAHGSGASWAHPAASDSGRQPPGGGPPNPAPLPARLEWRLAGDVGRRYGAASGDRNPIHLHPLTARLFGFPRAIAHGMWTVARCLAEHGTPDAAVVRAEFRAPVLLPGTVTYGAEGGRFELRGDSGRRLHLSGEAGPYPAA